MINQSNLKKRFINFIKENKFLVIFTYIFTFFLYFIKLVNHSFGMDSNYYIANPESYEKFWLASSRFGEVFLKKIFWNSFTNIYLINSLTILLFATSSILICYLFAQVSEEKNSKKKLFIIPILFLTNSIFVTQFYFVLQNFEFTLSLCCVILSVILTFHTNQTKNYQIFNYVLAVVLLVLSFAVYQTFILFFIVLTAAILMIEIRNAFYLNEIMPVKKFFSKTMSYISVLFISTIIYVILNKIVLLSLNIENNHHSRDMISWNSLGFIQGIKSVVKGFIAIVLFPNDPTRQFVYNYGTLLSILLLIPIVYLFVKYSKKNFLILLISLATLFISGFGIMIATGALPTPRSMAPQFPFLIAFLFFYESLFFENRFLKVGINSLVVLIAGLQFRTTSNLLLSEQMVYENDYRKMVQIDQSIKNLHLKELNTYKVMLVGASYTDFKFKQTVYNELIGESMFSFGGDEGVGVSTNVLVIMDSLGMRYAIPSREEYFKTLEKVTIQDSGIDLDIEVIDKMIVIRIY